MPDIPRDPTEEMHRHAVRTPPRVPRRDADVLKLPRRASIEGLGLGCPADRPALPGPVTADAAATWYRDVFDGLPTATLVTTLDGVVTHANTAACLLLRRPPDALLGHPIATFVPAPHRTAYEALLERAQQTAHVVDFALWVSPSDAAPVDCRAWVRRILTLGEPTTVLAWTLAPLVPAF
ncbi:PAS sensor protein [Gemmatirosa kalamazoonensis]|uniref:PAS sensor protein n=1 Tax=Gemmatirosa kalamazoonensis TaxID=861299 RepID=W0RMK4_9BACT|nr:PAS domain-containing protein [Gemmatirosa kalamazoonensis]AHG91555.1 PAS sensor protein [Gemmatirosa kalamazoonensis]